MNKFHKSLSWLMKRIDYIFFPLLIFGAIYIIYNYKDSDVSKLAQALTLYSTFGIIFHSVYIRDRFIKKRKEPEIQVNFNFSEPDCHLTDTDIQILEKGIEKISTYYIRMRIENIGNSTLENTEVILEKIISNGKALKDVLPLSMIWATTEIQQNRSVVQIPQKSFRTIDLVYIMDGSRINDLGIRGNRFEKLIKGIGICSLVKPNTISDVISYGEYEFCFSIISDNQKPHFVKMFLNYNGEWEYDIKKMFENNLKAGVISSGNSRNIFENN
ncbi:hypothetical protein ACFL2K_04910 [Candidatus Margulisiibacteriota bacterium]